MRDRRDNEDIICLLGKLFGSREFFFIDLKNKFFFRNFCVISFKLLGGDDEFFGVVVEEGD